MEQEIEMILKNWYPPISETSGYSSENYSIVLNGKVSRFKGIVIERCLHRTDLQWQQLHLDYLIVIEQRILAWHALESHNFGA
jgi:hypothetical protein